VGQIFISHSARDTRQIDFLNKAFATTNVQAKYEEIEAIVQGRRTAAQIRADIAASNAIMVLLGPNVEALKHTRDWVGWESGNAAARNKEVWVLEAYEDLARLSVVIPHVQHYVCFHYNDSWTAYLRQIVSSYDDSHVAKAILAGTGIGATFGPEGALVGAGAGLLLAAATTPQRPLGTQTMCPQCSSSYKVHIAMPITRCPICNARLQFAMAKAKPAGAQT
jgi:hypothetical protein